MIRVNDKVYFDADCLSAFLWINELGALVQLFKTNIIIPKAVYDELCHLEKFKYKLKGYIDKKIISVVTIGVGTEEFKTFMQIVYKDKHPKKFGNGEAEVLSHAICQTKKMASNNLSDVESYIKAYGLTNYTIPDLFGMLIEEKIKTEEEVESMWLKLKERDFRIPGDTYKEYLEKYKNKKV